MDKIPKTTATIYPGVVIDVGASGLVTITPEMIALKNVAVAAAAEAEADAATATTQAGIATTQAGIATTKATEATTQAGIATTQAGIATTQTNTATAQAGIATTKAAEASASATTATNQSGIATTQAGIATTQAGIATAQANTATAQATTATNQATAAANSAAQAALLGAVFGPGMIFNHTDQSIPTGWWDTGLRQTVTDSIWSTTSTLALISNWSVASLYTGGIATAFFDFTTAARLFQDLLGTVLTTAGQSIGMARDAISAQSFGAELVVNGDFAAATGWTTGTGWSISGGVAAKTAGTAASLSRAVSLTAGRTYRLTLTATVTAGTLTPRLTGGTAQTSTAINANGAVERYITAVTGNTTLDLLGDAAFAGSIDNVSLTEVLGIVATQPSASLRPLWRNDPLPAGGLSRGAARFDLVDDTLTFNLPAAVDGELWFAGRSGTWRETRLAASGATVTVGPTGTLATPGLLRAVGDVVAMGFRAGTMTADEWLRLKRRYRAEGAKGELIAGANMVTNGAFDADVSGWTQPIPARGTFDWSAGTARLVDASAGGLNTVGQSLTTVNGQVYLASAQIVEATNVTARMVAGTSNLGAQLGFSNLAANATGTIRLVFVATGTTTFITFQNLTSTAAGAQIRFDNVTVQPLTP